MCFKSKNLYNVVNYFLRHEFIDKGIYHSAFDMNKMFKNSEQFKVLPAKTSQQIIIQLGKNWKSFFKNIKIYNKNKNGYCGRPQLPKYKPKDGRNIVFFDYMQGTFKNEGKYQFSMSEEYIETKVTKQNFKLLRIVPQSNCYKIELIYETDAKEHIDNGRYIAIDLGLNNLVTITNNFGTQPIVVNGRILKSINNYSSKIRAKAMSYVKGKMSNRIRRIDLKRNNIIDTHFHKISRFIINYCLQNDVKNVIIGLNKDWKRNINIGQKNNQRFAQIPFNQLIKKIEYKAENEGIKTIVVDERYTSKSSFIDNDILPNDFSKEYEFSGKRIKRGLYKSKNGTLINADVNGSYNILRKGNSEFIYNDGIKGISFYPVILNI